MNKSATPRPTNAYRNALESKRQELVAALGAKFDALARMGRVAEDDQAAVSHEEFVSLQRNHLVYAQLRLVEEALDRLEAGDYGICLECEEPIAAKRLDAVPWARRCVPCQERVASEFRVRAAAAPAPMSAS